VEHEDERVAARVCLQAGDSKGSKARFPKQHAHVSHERDMGTSTPMHSFSARNAHRFAPLGQHGVSPGYYLTFLLGGFLTTVARLARSTIRPLVLPTVPGPTGGSKPANGHGMKLPTPPPTLMKTAYDVAGTVCTLLVVNFACIPHILLYLSASAEAWRRLQWYGLLMVFGSMAFFYGGGAAWLKGIQATRFRRANASVSGPGTPGVAPTVPPVDAVFQAVEKKLS
jgi:lysophospholipid acyltransferase